MLKKMAGTFGVGTEKVHDLPARIQGLLAIQEDPTWFEWKHDVFPELFLADFKTSEALRVFMRLGCDNLPVPPRASLGTRQRYFMRAYAAAKTDFFDSIRLAERRHR